MGLMDNLEKDSEEFFSKAVSSWPDKAHPWREAATGVGLSMEPAVILELQMAGEDQCPDLGRHCRNSFWPFLAFQILLPPVLLCSYSSTSSSLLNSAGILCVSSCTLKQSSWSWAPRRDDHQRPAKVKKFIWYSFKKCKKLISSSVVWNLYYFWDTNISNLQDWLVRNNRWNKNKTHEHIVGIFLIPHLSS